MERVVKCQVKVYGAALQYGLENAKGKYVLMGDSDDSYHFDEAMPLLNRYIERTHSSSSRISWPARSSIIRK